MSDLAAFSGKARLFPLPNLVLFPHVMQPLHIFEPRYRQMTADALEGDRVIAMVLPRPGWEADYAGKPAIHSIACLGRIIAEQHLDDGRFNILLRGHSRVRIIREVPSNKLYRCARVEILEEIPPGDEVCARHWRQTLRKSSLRWFADQEEVIDQFRTLLESDIALGSLCDIFAFALPLEADFKQTLLEELNVETRLKMLHDYMLARETLAAVKRKFPPEFSVN